MKMTLLWPSKCSTIDSVSCFVRFLAASIVIGLCASACAERVIFIPNGNKIRFSTVKFQSLYEGGSRRQEWGLLSVGVTREIEAEIEFEHFRPASSRVTAGLAYNFINPITDFAPGVTIGMLDILNQSLAGRRTFFAATYRFGQDSQYNQNSPMEFTLGISQGRRLTPIVGAAMPLTWQFKALAEHDGYIVSTGFEFKPVRNLAVRWIHRPHQTLWGLDLNVRF